MIRIGYNQDILPFAYFNSVGDLVGFDINMAHLLARDLGVSIEFVWFDPDQLAQMLRDDHFDIVMSGLLGTLERVEAMHHTEPYMDVTLAVVAPDYRIRRFATMKSIQQQDELRLGYVDVSPQFCGSISKVASQRRSGRDWLVSRLFRWSMARSLTGY